MNEDGGSESHTTGQIGGSESRTTGVITMPPMLWPVLGLLLIALAIALPLTALLVRVGHRAGVLDSPGSTGHVKSELRAVPNIGGVAIVASIAIPLAAGLLAIALMDDATIQRLVPALNDYLLSRVRASAPTAWALLGCLAALHVVGVLDDRRGLPAGPKLVVQLLAAAVMTIWFDVRLLELLDNWVPGASIVVTVLWIAGITNAINFLDNMDGLAAGVSAIAAAMFMTATLINEQYFIAATLALLIGALVGFLVFNFPPAKIFMGDGGSLVVGFLLAVLTARTTYYDAADPDFALGGGWYGVFMPVIVLAIPLYDMITVTIIRLRQGRSPWVGDQQHFSHRLVQRGMSKRGAVIMIWGATAVTAIGGVSLGQLEWWQAMLVGGQTILVLVMLALFEHASRHAVGRGT